MSTADAAAIDRAIANTVADVLGAAIAPNATVAACSTARDAAQMLGLDGLDRALAACSAHAGSALSADAAALADRIGRIAVVVREAGDLAPLRGADAELAALAHELDGYDGFDSADQGSQGAEAGAGARDRAGVAALRVSDVLEDVALSGDDSRAVARRSHLHVPVAAAVRAAIDWLSQPGSVAPLGLYAEPSLLELRIERIRTDRLYAAHRVLAAAGGNLGPAADGPGWVMRVPAYAERPTYLMVIQGGLRIAVPWHAVLKLRIVSTQPGVAGARPMEHVLLPPLAPPDTDPGERPVVLMGHGLKRAYLVADRLIWRMPADACENEWGTPGGGLRETVCTEDGEVFWVADPSRMLADVELPEIAAAPSPPPPPPPVALDPVFVEPLGAAPATPALTLERPGTFAAPPTTAPAVPSVTALAPQATASATPASAPAPLVPRALVVDDSLTTRLLLSRLLEQQGFVVESASTSIALMSRLHDAPWTVLFTDLELPDGSGPEWLRQVVRSAATRPSPVHVVALVRDGGDLDVARAAGLQDALLKPFARQALAALLARHGWLRR